MNYSQRLLARSYLKLLRDSLCNEHYRRNDDSPLSDAELRQAREVLEEVRLRFGHCQQTAVRHLLSQLTPELAVHWFRRNSWQAYTLLDPIGLDNLQRCFEQLLEKNVPAT